MKTSFDERIDIDQKRTIAVSSCDDGGVWIGAENGQESVCFVLTRAQSQRLACIIDAALTVYDDLPNDDHVCEACPTLKRLDDKLRNQEYRIGLLEEILTTIRDTLPIVQDNYSRQVFRLAAGALEPD